jgi:hypothetical protein
MPDQPNEQDRSFDAMERDVLYLLTDPERHPTIWALEDLGRQIETCDPMAVIRPLCCAGVVHRTGDCVFATPAAYKVVDLTGQVV